ncbi:MAG: T9SS type A sorting domain-containing protein [Ignavibacteriae bacterium]|nr:T9SS type A sorting domain-containing protein [Ignavibacteriota bacterium]
MSLYISVIFFDAQTQITAQGSLLCPFGTTASWQAFNVPMNYSGGSGNPSTSAHIQFTVSGTGNPTPADQIGSYFLLDDVAFAPPNAVVERTDTRPTLIALDQNYPNPFNPATTIRIDLPQQSFVDLRVYNLLGEEVASLVNQELKSGSYSTEWNAVGAASGVYVSVLRAGNSVLTRRMLLMK